MKHLIKVLAVFGFAFVLLPSCYKQIELDKTAKKLLAGDIALSGTLNYDSLIDKQIQFILNAQLPSGAIMNTSVPGSRICGYFANIACLGILEKPTTVNQLAVKKWMIWYMSKINGCTNPITHNDEVPGSVYDYFYTGTKDSTNGFYDSIDSYAASFLTLAQKYGSLSGANASWLSGYAYELSVIGDALTDCIDDSTNAVPTTFGPDDNDGLAIDSYVHGAKYLMDNAEVNEGLRALVWLNNNVFDPDDFTIYPTFLTKHTSAIENQLWRSTMYNWFDNGSTGSTISTWSNWYADAVGQLYPVMWNVIPATGIRATNLYDTFNVKYPSWSTGHVYDPGGFPWAATAYAGAKMGDGLRTLAYLNYLNSYSGTSQPTNWYIAEAGFSILAASLGRTLPTPVNLALSKTATASSNNSIAGNSNDGNLSTRWSSAVADNEWWKVDLGATKTISDVIIRWETAYATSYSIQVSTDNITYSTVYSTTSGNGGDDEVSFVPTSARYVKILCQTRVQPVWGSSFWEAEVY